MKYILSPLITFSFLFLCYSHIHAQPDSTEIESTQISILTCRSGSELYSTFGHTAIRVLNKEYGSDFVFNYGLFSFNTPYFYPKFMRGQLPYFVGATSMQSFLREYQYEKRSVFEQVLVLNNYQKRKIIDFLIENVKPENRAYKYDFFFDNCATRVVDVFSLAGDVSYTYKIEEKTFRDLLKENLKSLVWSDFGIDLVIGARADRITNRRDQMFLPEYVLENLASAIVDGSNLLAMPSELILNFEELNSERKKNATNWPLFCTSLLLLITIIVNTLMPRISGFYNKAILSICGVLGLFLLFMWFGTNHGATRDNWNVMWLNPLLLIYLLAGSSVKKNLRYILSLLLCISALNCIITFLPQFFNIAFLPIIGALILIIYTDFKALNNSKTELQSQKSLM